MFFLSAKIHKKKIKFKNRKGGTLLSVMKKLMFIFHAQERIFSRFLCADLCKGSKPQKRRTGRAQVGEKVIPLLDYADLCRGSKPQKRRTGRAQVGEKVIPLLNCAEPCKGSMTIEACFVLPFFIFAFINVTSIIELYRLQGNMSAAMHDTVKNMSIYGYEYKEIKGNSKPLGLTYLYAANKVINTLGKEYIDSSPISGGAASIIWFRSNIMTKDDCIDLISEYKIKPPIAIIAYKEFTMYNRLRTRAWTGYDNANTNNNLNIDDEIVYITPDGTAYHSSRSCAYLKLSIVAIDTNFLSSQRNENGEKYYPCEECGNSSMSTVYITNYGNRYHNSLNCSKLKRTILAVPLSQAVGRTPCTKCS